MDTVKKSRFWRFLALTSVVGMLFAGLLAASSTPVEAHNPGIAPPNSNPYGQSYAEWAADWWTWMIEAGGAPNADTDGSSCGMGQSGQVWFLAGVWGGMPPVERDCEVPSGKALFFPVQNNAWLSYPDDPWIGYDVYEYPGGEDVVRDGLAAANDASGGRSATIDDRAVDHLDDYRFTAPTFFAQWPDWLYLGPNFDDGWYLMVRPLSVGEHTVEFTGWDGGLDVTYNLTVVAGD